MEMITDSVHDAYRSARLHYVRIDKDDEHIRAFLNHHLNDPTTHALTSTTQLRPQGKAGVDYTLGEYANSLLGVAVCLLPSNDAPPVIIGAMTLGEGGIPGAIVHNRTASIGISVSQEHQNKGYGREAINWMLDWAFRHGGLHTVSINTSSFNTRAAHLYEVMGFTLEGRHRECVWFNRQWYDELLYSMMEGEWEKLQLSM